MFKLIQKSLKGEKGFTLIELLVVVAIIGILVAIAIPQFSAYKKNANDASAQADIHSMQLAAEGYYASNSNLYPVTVTYGPGPATVAATDPLGTAGFAKVSTGNTLTFTNTSVAGTQAYTITASNVGGSKTYTFNSLSGGLQ
jgi:type IV pilus assembly protein PilA